MNYLLGLRLRLVLALHSVPIPCVGLGMGRGLAGWLEGGTRLAALHGPSSAALPSPGEARHWRTVVAHIEFRDRCASR